MYHASDEKILQQVFEDQAFRPGETKAYRIVWTPPPGAAPGDSVVRVGVFAPGWGKRYDWNDAAARLTVVR